MFELHDIVAWAIVLAFAAFFMFLTFRQIAARPRQPWMPMALVAAIALVALSVDFAIAQETVAQAAGETTKVTWAWGETIAAYASAIRDAAFAALAAAIAWAGRKLPAQLFSILVTLRVEQFLKNAIEYGINAVAEASKDKKLSVDVGNEVLAKALQYIVDNAPGWLISWMGGQEGIAQKIWARLNLEPKADDAVVKEAIESASPTG